MLMLYFICVDFAVVLPEVTAAIEQCSFITFDGEFTGVCHSCSACDWQFVHRNWHSHSLL